MENVFEEWDEYSLKKELNQREVNLENLLKSSELKIVAITGVRRAGKTSLLLLLRQLIKEKNKKGAYINLEGSRIKDKEQILDEVLKWFGDSGYLLLDEVTSASDWTGWLARNHEMLKGKLHLIVSSSRRNLVTPSKPLRGRMLPQEMYPLSFKEFLKFNNVKIEKTTAGMGKIEKALTEYLIYGGFPEVVLFKDKMEKLKVLDSYFSDIIGLDVAEIAEADISTVELFGKYVIEAPYFSASKCLNFFKSRGHKIGKQSILDLERCSQEGYLFFFAPIFSHTIKDRSQYPRKAYLGDTGFIYAISGKKDWGRLFENAAFLELKRRKKQNENLNYWKDKQGVEADFVIREGMHVKEIIQVVYDMEDPKTKEREIRGLVSCAKALGSKKGIIITKNQERIETHEGIKIKYIPLWKWLLK